MSLRTDALVDLTTIFNSDDFCQVATLADASTVNVFIRPAISDEFGIENREVEITAIFTDVSSLVHGNTLTIGGIIYKIIQTPRDDGNGRATFRVSKD